MKARGGAARRLMSALALLMAGALSLGACSRADNQDAGVIASASSASPTGEERPKRKRKLALPAGPEELALVAPLEIGEELAGWEVRFIGAVEEGRLPIGVAHEGESVRLDIVLASEDAPTPPAATRRFHVYYRARNVPQAEAIRLSRALAEVIAQNGNVVVPRGMAVYENAGHDPWADGI